MAELARHSNAYIRPSPSGGTLGGVARRTRDVIRLVEAAGFDVVLIETVGVGQSETAVSNLSDAFVLLVAPAGGDELQGVKRGIMELADLIVVNKCDGSLAAQARATLAEYASAIRLVRPASLSWTPIAMAASALTGDGITGVWEALGSLRKARENSGEFFARRVEQQKAWLWTDVAERILDDLRADDRTADVVGEVQRGDRSIASAVDEIVRLRLS
jgi:LAO/AO transport system kinase